MMNDVHHSKHVPQWKREEVEELKDLIEEHSVVGVVGMRGIPSKQLQQMRAELDGVALLRMSRNTFIDRALDELGLEDLKEHIHDQTALIFTEENPFKLYKTLEASKTPAPIKAGAEAPRDIQVEKGATSFAPGPIVGDLQQAGIPAAIEGGKVVIREDKVVAHEGETVGQRLAEMLARLEIYPMEVGLDLRAAYEDGIVFDPSTLAIDLDRYRGDIIAASQAAVNLGVNSAYPIRETITTLLATAQGQGMGLATEANVYASDVMPTILSRAQQRMLGLAGAVGDVEGALDEDLGQMLKGTGGATAEPEPEEEAEEEDEETAEEEEEEEDEEESGMEGLESLF